MLNSPLSNSSENLKASFKASSDVVVCSSSDARSENKTWSSSARRRSLESESLSTVAEQSLASDSLSGSQSHDLSRANIWAGEVGRNY